MAANPINALRQEHANMRSVLVLIRDVLDAIETGKEPDFVLLANALYYMRKFPGRVHHPKEDMIFAKLALADPNLAADVDLAHRQHKEIYELEDHLIEEALNLPKVGSLARGDDHGRDDCACLARGRLLDMGRHYLEMQRKHSEGEERVLFPSATKLLKAKDWAEVERRFKEIDDPLFGTHSGDRYDLLYEHLMRESIAS